MNLSMLPRDLPARPFRAKPLAALTCVSLLAACSLFAPKFERPNLSVMNIQMLDGNFFQQNFLVRLKIQNPNDRATISRAIDNLFANSPAETKTQTEKEFQQSFVSMSGAIITAINVVSFVIIGIILLVLSNTMVMTARERIREYAVMKTLGFTTSHITTLIAGESLLISSIGGILGLAVTFPIAEGIHKGLPTGWFPVFSVEPITVILAASTAILAGVISSVFPITKAAKMKIVDGLRQIG